ncbi:entericidin A/B family lipoprotein [Parasutterella muris]|uniref:Entericidin A/B family lipoprotein n=1 Tax=Parasutterella muris TaxID=2565572 RepID=A0A6L6YGR3_9BURK|nr:entericidin A/B family lipoprotein [Parasutterella muris]MVX56032.1 entericidin A/B family lipoprotein [Parasutterella muris]
MKKLSFLAILAAMMFAFSGCNTISGIGKDVSAVGRSVDHAATKTSAKISSKTSSSSSSSQSAESSAEPK